MCVCSWRRANRVIYTETLNTYLVSENKVNFHMQLVIRKRHMSEMEVVCCVQFLHPPSWTALFAWINECVSIVSRRRNSSKTQSCNDWIRPSAVMRMRRRDSDLLWCVCVWCCLISDRCVSRYTPLNHSHLLLLSCHSSRLPSAGAPPLQHTGREIGWSELWEAPYRPSLMSSEHTLA